MLSIDALRNFGANIEEGMARCLNNEAFYLRMVGMGMADGNFERLESSVESGDAHGAFEAAHALKGSIGNLALTPIYRPVSELTEMLRGRTELPPAAQNLCSEVMAQLGKLKTLAE